MGSKFRSAWDAVADATESGVESGRPPALSPALGQRGDTAFRGGGRATALCRGLEGDVAGMAGREASRTPESSGLPVDSALHRRFLSERTVRGPRPRSTPPVPLSDRLRVERTTVEASPFTSRGDRWFRRDSRDQTSCQPEVPW